MPKFYGKILSWPDFIDLDTTGLWRDDYSRVEGRIDIYPNISSATSDDTTVIVTSAYADVRNGFFSIDLPATDEFEGRENVHYIATAHLTHNGGILNLPPFSFELTEDTNLAAVVPLETSEGLVAPGPAGPRGPKGEKGDTGPRGAIGARGAIGPRGPQGDVGPQGDRGPIGPTGERGEPGPEGDTGPTGPKGDTGATGPKGATGATGPKGDKGATGARGATGAKGDKGDKGEPGAGVPSSAGRIVRSSSYETTFVNTWKSVVGFAEDFTVGGVGATTLALYTGGAGVFVITGEIVFNSSVDRMLAHILVGSSEVARTEPGNTTRAPALNIATIANVSGNESVAIEYYISAKATIKSAQLSIARVA